MKQTLKFMALCAVLALTLQSSFAQSRTSSKSGGVDFDAEPIKAEDIEFKITRLAMEKAYHDDGLFPVVPKVKSGAKSTWAMLLVEYEWKLKSKAKSKKTYSVMADRRYYIDSLSFDWSVVIAEPTDGKSIKYSSRGFNITEQNAVRMSKKITYRDVNDDGKHFAIVFIEPKILLRYQKRLSGNKFFVKLTVKLGGEELARLNSHGEEFIIEGEKTTVKELDKFIPRRKKTDSSMHLSDRVKRLKGVLLSRIETPWKWSNLGNLEMIDTEKKDD